MSGMNDKFRGLELCILVDSNKRITSNTFNVYIPRLMPRIENGDVGESKEKIDKAACKQKGLEEIYDDEIEVQNYICAKNATPYRYAQDGRIPEFKVATMTFDTIEASTIDGITEKAGPGPHEHMLKKKLTLNKVTAKDIVVTDSTEVDYIDTNKIYISKGHIMYGQFVAGTANEFVVQYIENVTPRYDE